MTLFDFIVVAGTAELVALVWILAAQAWPKEERFRSMRIVGRSASGRPGGVRAGKAVTRHPLAAPRPEGESVPGG